MNLQHEILHSSKILSKKVLNENIMDSIINIVCAACDVNYNAMKTKCRKRELVIARQLIHYFLYEYTNMSTNLIGQITGHDHSTVVYSRRKVENFKYDYILKAIYLEIQNKINRILN